MIWITFQIATGLVLLALMRVESIRIAMIAAFSILWAGCGLLALRSGDVIEASIDIGLAALLLYFRGRPILNFLRGVIEGASAELKERFTD